METVKEQIINVQEIEPRLRHQTIFQTFNTLKEGESLIIHNNHDPKPVYYQLMDLRGNIFSWEYLQQGPEWWDIRVTRTVPSVPTEKEELIINVPGLEPQQKHAAIFRVFDHFEAGESFIIHNDHDPKPVYYQLQNERGNIFTWEYLQEGPIWWDIRVTKKTAETKETIGEIVAKDMHTAAVFKKFKIDFCCGGKKTIKEACMEKGIDPALVEQELKKTAQNTASGNMNYDEWNPDFLADFIINTHHNYIKKHLPEILGYAKKVARVHGDRHAELMPIHELVEKVNKELSEHILHEENTVFPAIKDIIKAKATNSVPDKNTITQFNTMIATTEKEHDTVGKDIHQIRELSKNYAIPSDACTSYKLLYNMLEEFENDLFTHIHLENNILFPKVKKIIETFA